MYQWRVHQCDYKFVVNCSESVVASTSGRGWPAFTYLVYAVPSLCKGVKTLVKYLLRGCDLTI